jgi:phenylalanyl-tRNA synthetase beta subunit
MGYDPGETLVLKNPTSPETSRLRTTLIPNLLALIPKNRHSFRSFRLFEIGRVFVPVKQEECLEIHYLAGVAFQRAGSWEELYFSVKTAVEDILAASGNQNVAFKESETPLGLPWASEGHCVEITSNGHRRGLLGILDKGMNAKVCQAGGQVAWFEIYLDEVASVPVCQPNIEFEEPPKEPPTWIDFSLLWSIDDDFAKLEALLDKFEHPFFIRRAFVESYKGKGLDKGMACYSFRFWIGSPDHTLSGEEIESFHQQFLAYIKQKNISLRT